MRIDDKMTLKYFNDLAYEEIGRLKHIISEKDELIEILENRVEINHFLM